MATELHKKGGVFERSPMTDLILERIMEMQPGDLLTYGELNRLIAGDVQDGEYHYLRSARDIALRDGVVTDAVTNEGIKRLDDAGSVSHAGGRVKKMHRQSKRIGRVLGSVGDPSLLSARDRQSYDIATLVAGVTRYFTSSNYQKRVLKEAEDSALLPSPQAVIMESMKLFRPDKDADEADEA